MTFITISPETVSLCFYTFLSFVLCITPAVNVNKVSQYKLPSRCEVLDLRIFQAKVHWPILFLIGCHAQLFHRNFWKLPSTNFMSLGKQQTRRGQHDGKGAQFCVEKRQRQQGFGHRRELTSSWPNQDLVWSVSPTKHLVYSADFPNIKMAVGKVSHVSFFLGH